MDASQKLAQFLDEVNQSIDHRILTERNQAQSQADAWIQESEARSIAEAERNLADAKSKIAAKYKKRVSQTGFRCQTALLQKQQALLQELFRTLHQKLKDFTETEAYGTWMETLLKTHQPGSDAVVLLRKEDMPMAERLQAVCRNAVEIRTDASIRIGGLSILSADGSVCENRTLDEAYLIQTRDFYRNHHLNGGAAQ